MKYLSEISKIIDRHRAEVVITCEKTCWCWDVEAAICGHEEVASQSGVEADAESRAVCSDCSFEYGTKDCIGCEHNPIRTA